MEGAKGEARDLRIIDVGAMAYATASVGFHALPPEPTEADAGPQPLAERRRTRPSRSQAAAPEGTEGENRGGGAAALPRKALKTASREEPRRRENEDGSGSESTESSSSSASEAKAPPRPPRPGDAFAVFVTRIRNSLVNCQQSEARDKIVKMVKNPQGFVKTSGGTIDEVKAFSKSLFAEYGGVLAEVASSPNASPKASPTAESGGAPPTALSAAAAAALLAAPAAATKDLPHHRTLEAPTKGLLKKNMQPRRTGRGCVGICTAQGEVSETRKSIPSLKPFLEQLWYKMPGAYVECDQCGNCVPQSLGCLKANPGEIRSQFAADSFLCFTCNPPENWVGGYVQQAPSHTWGGGYGYG